MNYPRINWRGGRPWGYNEMSSILADSSYMSPNAGERGVTGSQPMRTSVHITWHGAQINFRHLTPYLTYGGGESGDIPPAPTPLYSICNNALMQSFEQIFKDDMNGFPSTSDIFFMGPWFTWQDSCCVPSPLNLDNILTHWSCSQDVLSHMHYR